MREALDGSDLGDFHFQVSSPRDSRQDRLLKALLVAAWDHTPYHLRREWNGVLTDWN